jgi:hypothetical protein
MFVSCDTQEEVDYYWEKLTSGGKRKPMRLAERQIRPVLADRPESAGSVARRQRSGEIEARDGSDVAEAED